ncbi:MAG: FAD-dependent oxidoreductase [Sedimentisphaerales bacterium]|nr:FAD-dependent oxidoreductase [Sedimentisphaerales bacterium]
MRIGIVGAGHAGVEAARRARSRGAEVVLFSQESVHPYFRPRVVALAFGRVEPEGMQLRPQEWYGDTGVDLRLNAPVIHIDVHAKAVTAGGKEESFDALILATGASPALLAFVQEFAGDVIPLWSADASLVIRERLRNTRDLVIIGGGISGIESVLYAREAGITVTVIERMDRPMATQFGARAMAILAHRLQEKGVHLLTGRSAVSMSRTDGRLNVVLDDASELPCELVLTTVGATRKLELFHEAGIKTDKGIVVDEYLQTSVPGVFACGDIAQHDHVRTATVLRAHQHGRGAADNAIAFLEGRPLTDVPEPVSPLSFKHSDIEFHSIGQPVGDKLEERVLSDDGKSVYRSILLEDGVLRGIQMIGSHEDFSKLADSLNQTWQAPRADTRT